MHQCNDSKNKTLNLTKDPKVFKLVFESSIIPELHVVGYAK